MKWIRVNEMFFKQVRVMASAEGYSMVCHEDGEPFVVDTWRLKNNVPDHRKLLSPEGAKFGMKVPA